MALNVFTNVSSLNTQRQLGKTTDALAKSFERLSSGLRINRAGDDAAGLAISERMDAQIRGMDQARRNTADGVSMVQTVEGGLGEINSILQRLRELAVQSASDSNTASDRKTLDNEANQLISSLDQIASSTEFNGQKVLDGTVAGLTFQTGANNQVDQRLQVSLGGVRASQLGNLAREKGAAVNSTDIAGSGDLVINGINVVASTTYGSDVGDVASVNDQNDSAYAKAKAINASNVGAKAVAEAAVDTNTFAATSTTYTLSINNVTIFEQSNASSVEDMVSRINAHSDETGVVATSSGGTFTLTAADGRNINISNSGMALQGFAAGSDQIQGKITLTSDKNIVIASGGALVGFSASDTVSVDNSNLNTAVSLLTRDTSLESIDRIDGAMSRVLDLRGRMGAVQNRLEATSSNLATVSENLSAARSRIRDADFAMETASLTRNQILQQAASAMLAQANQAPQQALALLR